MFLNVAARVRSLCVLNQEQQSESSSQNPGRRIPSETVAMLFMWRNLQLFCSLICAVLVLVDTRRLFWPFLVWVLQNYDLLLFPVICWAAALSTSVCLSAPHRLLRLKLKLKLKHSNLAGSCCQCLAQHVIHFVYSHHVINYATVVVKPRLLKVELRPCCSHWCSRPLLSYTAELI